VAKGPAPKGEYAGKSSVFSTRIRPDLRKKMAAAAKKSGRSLSQEVEHRLRRSFVDDEKISDIFGDRQTFSLMRMMALAIHMDPHLPTDSKSTWLDDPERFETAVAAALSVLEAIRPEGLVSYDRPLQQILQTRGEFAAFQIWRKVQRANASLPLDQGTSADHRNAILKADLKGLVDIANADHEWNADKDRG
jgi:hypothetical protein